MVLLRLHGGHGTLLCTHLVLQLYGDFVSTDRFQQVLIFVDRHGNFDHGKLRLQLRYPRQQEAQRLLQTYLVFGDPSVPRHATHGLISSLCSSSSCLLIPFPSPDESLLEG